MQIEKIDIKIIDFLKRISMPLARFSLFVVFFYFGILKVVGLSPASQLVQNLFENTIGFMPFGTFIILFGLFECLIGVLFIIRGLADCDTITFFTYDYDFHAFVYVARSYLECFLGSYFRRSIHYKKPRDNISCYWYCRTSTTAFSIVNGKWS